MLTELPADVLQEVYKKLNVKDRVALDVALCKKGGVKHDRTLGILHRAATKRKVAKPHGQSVLRMLRPYQKRDPVTVSDILDALKMQHPALCEPQSEFEALLEVVREMTPDAFDKLPADTRARITGGFDMQMMYRCALHNSVLFGHIAANPENEENVVKMVKRDIRYFLCNKGSLEVVIKHAALNKHVDWAGIYSHSFSCGDAHVLEIIDKFGLV